MRNYFDKETTLFSYSSYGKLYSVIDIVSF